MTKLPVNLVRTDGGTQPRTYREETVIDEYARTMQEGNSFPPIVVFHDGACYWLADGFHRLAATSKIGRSEIEAELHQGSVRDAILYSVGANATHGMQRTNADKRQSVKRMLEDPEWSNWSDNQIAKACRVSQPFVSYMRPVIANNVISSRQYQNKGGNVHDMDTSRIGGKAPGRATVHGLRAGSTSSNRPPTTRPPGHREKDHGDPDLALEQTLRALAATMRRLPAADKVGARFSFIDVNHADEFSQWWADYADAVRERGRHSAHG